MTNQEFSNPFVELDSQAEPVKQDFKTALAEFVETTQVRLTDEHLKDYPTLVGYRPKLTTEPGSKNVRVVLQSGPQRSVFCFVRKADGAILKAAGWKAPAKHARGSIFVNKGQDAVGTYGANYLR